MLRLWCVAVGDGVDAGEVGADCAVGAPPPLLVGRRNAVTHSSEDRRVKILFRRVPQGCDVYTPSVSPL